MRYNERFKVHATITQRDVLSHNAAIFYLRKINNRVFSKLPIETKNILLRTPPPAFSLRGMQLRFTLCEQLRYRTMDTIDRLISIARAVEFNDTDEQFRVEMFSTNGYLTFYLSTGAEVRFPVSIPHIDHVLRGPYAHCVGAIFFVLRALGEKRKLTDAAPTERFSGIGLLNQLNTNKCAFSSLTEEVLWVKE